MGERHLPSSLIECAEDCGIAGFSFIPGKVPLCNSHCHHHVSVSNDEVASPKEAEEKVPQGVVDIVIEIVSPYLLGRKVG